MVALLAAAVLFTNISLPGGNRSRPAALRANPSGATDAVASSGVKLVDTFTKRAGRLVHGRSMWFAAALGVGISLPSVDYIALLLIIAASGESPEVQVTALFTFLVVANALLLVPIIGYAIAKERTIRVLDNLRSWVFARSRRDYAVLLGIAGALMITVGLTHL